MHEFRPDEIRSILCLGGHADDLEIGCGGTLLEILGRCPGIDVHWVVFSAIDRRAQEATASAERFLTLAGQKRVVVLEYHDTFFPAAYGSIKEYFEQIKSSVAPDLIFTHRREDMHQDHRVIAELTWCAFRDHLILEYEIPKYEGDLGAPNFFVPLEEAVCRRKIEAIVECFSSQHMQAVVFGGHLLGAVAASRRGVQLSHALRRGLLQPQAARKLDFPEPKECQSIAREQVAGWCLIA